MTAFILRRYADRVEILSDGAVYMPDGTVVDIAYKVRTSPAVPLALTASGPLRTSQPIAEMIMQAAEATGSVDATLAIVESSLATIATEGFANDSPVRMAIGAISETYGPVTLTFSTFPEPGSPQGEPFVLHNVPVGFGQGELPPLEDMAAQGYDLVGDRFAALDKFGPFMFEYMRGRKRINPASPTDEPIFCVGGHLDHTIIRAGGYEHRRLLTWPDEIGRKIEPHS